MDGIKVCECGAENPASRHFCGKCGKLLDRQHFSNDALYETEELKIHRILDNLQHTPHERIVWDDTANLYARKVERYLAMLALPELENEQTRADLEKLLSLCRKPEFQIAFVGTIKTGKSTLINALLEHNYASMAVTPETAALTKFRSSAKDYVHVTFYSPEEWQELWASRTAGADAFVKEFQDLNGEEHKSKWVSHPPYHRELANSEIEEELQIWSSSKRAEHYFVKEIEVGISNLPNIPHQVVFVDTPGLSDPVAYRSEITRQYIRQANAVFVCVDAQKMQKEELETIASVFSFSSHNRSKVHIIATHWDNLNNPEKDWNEQKAWMIKRLTGKGFFPDEEMAEANIMYSSAYIHNLCRDIDKISDKQKLLVPMVFKLDIPYDPAGFTSPEGIKKICGQLMKRTNIDNIKKVLIEKLANQFKILLMEELGDKYQHIVINLRRLATDGQKQQQGFIEATGASIQQMEEKIELQRRNCEEITQCREQLLAVLKTVNKNTQKRLDAVVEMIDGISRKSR